MQVTYTCTYTQLHNLKNTKLPSGKRTADLRIEKQNGEWRVTIATIMLGNNQDIAEAKRKEEEKKAAEAKAKQEQLKKEQELAEAKRKEEEKKATEAKAKQEQLKKEQDFTKHIKAISEEVIMQYENLLNTIADKYIYPSTIEETIKENLERLFYTPNIKLQDDLNGTEKNMVMADASKYLSDFNLYYTKNQEGRSVQFTDIKVGEPKQGNYLYLQVTYTCTYTQLHNVTKTKLPSGKRTADLFIEKQNGEWRVTIATIMLGNNPVPATLTNLPSSFTNADKDAAQAKELAEAKAKQEQLKKEQELAQAKQEQLKKEQELAQAKQEQLKKEQELAEAKQAQLKKEQELAEAKKAQLKKEQELAEAKRKEEEKKAAEAKAKQEQLKKEQELAETKRKQEEQKAAEEKAKQEQLKKEQELAEAKAKQAQLKQEQELAEAKRKEEEQAEKLAQKQAKQAKLDSMVAARKKITTKPKQPLPIYIAFDYNWLNTDQQKVQGRMGVSVFTSSIGVFFNGWKQHQDTPPTDYRTAEQLDIINYYLQRDANTNGNNTNYINTTYTASGAKLTTFNWGVYAPAIRRVPAIGGSVWAMGGVAHLKGNVWDIYEGNLNNTDNFNPINTYTPEGINQYAIDYTHINKADLMVGIAYVRPFVQAQIGYNNLLRNFFVSTGVNMPIKTKKVKQYKANKTNSANPKN